MKNIWIDGYEANVAQRLGSGQVAYALIRQIEKLDRRNKYTVFLPNPPFDDLPKERLNFSYRVLKPNKLWTRIALPLALFTAKKKPDVFFTPTHYIPRFTPKNVKRVVTIFDLSYLFFPQMFKKRDLWQLNNWTKYSITNADHIITISQSAKKDIIKNYQITNKKITVAYPGFNEDIYQPIRNGEKISQVLKKYGIEDHYIIFVGTVQPRKNLKKLIEAFIKIDNVKLVVVGKVTGAGRQAWMYQDIIETPKKLGIEEKIIFTDFVPDEDLKYLLNGATAFILPSLWEGFGIPAVEAMACGVPVIVSNVSSLPEAVGKAGLLVDPNSADQIEQAIRTVSTDKKLHAKLSKLGLEQARKFSWQKMAREVIKVLENV